MNALGNWAGMLYLATTWVVPVILAVTFHEAAHGFVASQFGDDTAARAGRVTFNPLKHGDPFGIAHGMVHPRAEVEDAGAKVDALGRPGEVAHHHLARRQVAVLGQRVVF